MTGNVILHVQFRKRRGYLLFPAIDPLGGQQAMPLVFASGNSRTTTVGRRSTGNCEGFFYVC
jgi:hypothetical protein